MCAVFYLPLKQPSLIVRAIREVFLRVATSQIKLKQKAGKICETPFCSSSIQTLAQETEINNRGTETNLSSAQQQGTRCKACNVSQITI